MSELDYGEPWLEAEHWRGRTMTRLHDPVIDNYRMMKRVRACVNACAGMTDPAAEIATLNAELSELREWKRQQLEVESQWDCQKIGKMLGVPLGANIREHIELSVTGLLDHLANHDAEIAKLRADLDSLDAVDKERNDTLKVCMNLLETMHFNRRIFKVDAYTAEIEAAMAQIKTCLDPHA